MLVVVKMYVDKIDSRKKRGRKKNWASLLETAWKKTRKAGGEEKSEKARGFSASGAAILGDNLNNTPSR